MISTNPRRNAQLVERKRMHEIGLLNHAIEQDCDSLARFLDNCRSAEEVALTEWRGFVKLSHHLRRLTVRRNGLLTTAVEKSSDPPKTQICDEEPLSEQAGTGDAELIETLPEHIVNEPMRI